MFTTELNERRKELEKWVMKLLASDDSRSIWRRVIARREREVGSCGICEL